MKTTPLYEIHRSLGAKFVEAHGWEMPAHYGDPLSEHLAVRKGAGIMDASHRGKVRISGRDRTLFLQKILSQDINRLTPGSGAYSTLLDVKGRMLAYMRIYCDEESFLMDTEPGLNEKIVQTLNHYLFRESVVIEDVTLKYGLVTIQGPRSRELLRRVTGIEVADMPECAHLNPDIKDINCKVVRTTYTGEEGYDIYAPWDDLHPLWRWLTRGHENPACHPELVSGSLGKEIPKQVRDDRKDSRKAVSSSEIPLFGLDALETLRIEAGTPLYSVDMDEATIPIEANLDHAISYSKGCYIGQETISRIKFRGHVNRTFTGFAVNPPSIPPPLTNPPLPPFSKGGMGGLTDQGTVPEKGDRVYKIIHDIEHPIGVITSGCLSPTLSRPIALGYIRIEYSDPGESVLIDRGGQRLTAAVTRLPFVKKTLTTV
ncbi:MAG: aminomethyl transferase family protein [Nitrospirae bacterium]|nr:aminomethyl transferase family protein [Nitrospirota bacterium]